MLMDTCDWSSRNEFETLNICRHTETSSAHAFHYQCCGAENEEQLPEWSDPMNSVSLNSHISLLHFEDPAYEFEVAYESPLLKDGEMITACSPTDPLSMSNNTSGAYLKGDTDNLDCTKVNELQYMNHRPTSLSDVNDVKSFLSVSSPDSKENYFEESLANEWPVQTDGIYDDNDAYVKSFQSVVKGHDSGLAVMLNGKSTVGSKFRTSDNSVGGTNMSNQNAIQILKLKENISIGKNILKLPNTLTHNCQNLCDSYSKNKSVKHPFVSEAYVKALNDHEYTMKLRPTSLSSENSDCVSKRSTSVPSFLELLLRCQTKLNPNLGSDCLLSSDGVLGPQRLNCRNVKQQCTRRRNDKNKPPCRTQIHHSRYRSSAYIANESALSRATKSDGSEYKTLLCDEVNKNMLKMELPSSCRTEQMGVDHILTDGFGLDSCPWVGDDLHGNGFDFFEVDLVGDDITEEHNDWLQEEHRQEDEYLKSYLRK